MEGDTGQFVLRMPSLAGPPALGEPTISELGVVPSMASSHLSLRRRVRARATESALQVEDCQYPHPKAGYWCVLRFRVPVHCSVTGGKLELWSRKDCGTCCPSALHGSLTQPSCLCSYRSVKGALSCLCLLNGPGILVTCRLCVVDQRSRMGSLPAPCRGGGATCSVIMNGISFAFVPRPKPVRGTTDHWNVKDYKWTMPSG